MIKITHLNKTYKTPEMETTALRDISLDIAQGELIAVTGPSGCGKSTLLNMLGMIDRPDSGSYCFRGTEIANYSEQQRSQLRKENIGFIFQNFNLVNELTVYENIELPLLYTKMKAADRRERVAVLLEQMKLSHRSTHYPQQLSGGQQQRVAVGRAISNRPAILLADEPTGNLDSRHGDEVMTMLLELNEAGTTIVIVTHANQYAQLCRRVVKLLDGQIITEHNKTGFYV